MRSQRGTQVRLAPKAEPGDRVELMLTPAEVEMLTRSERCGCGHLVALHNYDLDAELHCCQVGDCECRVDDTGERVDL